METSRWAWGAGAVFVWAALRALSGHQSEALAGTQQCNTECQSKMTDCILACDGMRSCEEICKHKARSCVMACAWDAGPPSTIAPGDGGAEVTPGVGERDAALTDARLIAPRDARLPVAPRDR